MAMVSASSSKSLCSSSTPKTTHLNILLLGKSGVGKSTFINAFSNYLKFSDISEIKTKSDVDIKIPFISQMFDLSENSNIHGSHLNPDGNESLRPMSSQTRSCKSYQFTFPDLCLTLIDTPGILDTDGGVDQDNSNMEDTIKFISQYESINGIAILLRSDEKRLDDTLRYSFLQFLNQFHRSAVQNLVYIFTHAGNSSITRPGQCSTAVKLMLDKISEKDSSIQFPCFNESHFYVDSDSLEFLVTKDYINYDKLDVMNFTRNWKKSKSECGRLIEYIQTLPVHNLQETMVIQRARTLIESLLPLLLRIGKNIVQNKENLKQKETEIEEFQGTIAQLREQLFITQTRIVTEHFDAPRIVCRSSKCCKEVC